MAFLLLFDFCDENALRYLGRVDLVPERFLTRLGFSEIQAELTNVPNFLPN